MSHDTKHHIQCHWHIRILPHHTPSTFWAGLSLLTLESGGRAVYMETDPYQPPEGGEPFAYTQVAAYMMQATRAEWAPGIKGQAARYNLWNSPTLH
jgi:hypothetical protein